MGLEAEHRGVLLKPCGNGLFVPNIIVITSLCDCWMDCCKDLMVPYALPGVPLIVQGNLFAGSHRLPTAPVCNPGLFGGSANLPLLG